MGLYRDEVLSVGPLGEDDPAGRMRYRGTGALADRAWGGGMVDRLRGRWPPEGGVCVP